MKILHVVKNYNDRHHRIHKALKEKLHEYDIDVVFESSRAEYFQIKDDYDLVHFLREDLMYEWQESGDIMTIENYEKFDPKLANKCIRVIALEKNVAIKVHLDHKTFNHQLIPRCPVDHYHHEKVYETYKSLYINVEMEKRGIGIVTIDSKHDNMMVSFGGLGNRFNFWNILKDLNAKKVFLKDQYHAWYQKGISKEVNTVSKVANELKKIIEEKKPKHTVFIGDSAGGCAAILFGHLVGADSVLSFNAQTFVTQELRLKHRDDRWQETADKYLDENEGFNLRQALRYHNGKTKYYLFYSNGHGLDRIHNENLGTTGGVTLVPINSNYHGVAGELKKLGYLKDLLVDTCEKDDYAIINKIKSQ